MCPTIVRPKKRLGQHFLIAPYYAKRIAEAVPAGADENVLEIGPGSGALSVHLYRRYPQLHCVEKDREIVPHLREKLGSGTYVLHEEDVLVFDFSKAGFPLHVVGNLPYSVAALILRKTLLYGNRIRSCTFTVQKEVAERICARPHSKKNGFLSIFCQFFGSPKILFRVPPGAFFPKPKVDSSVFQIVIEDGLGSKLSASRWHDFFVFVGKGFSMRRKKLINALSSSNAGIDLPVIFEQAELHPFSRAEDLGISEWLNLFRLVIR